MLETYDLTDSFELRRSATASDCVDGLLGGRPGDICSESRLGSAGARLRFGSEGVSFSMSVLLLCGRAGGAFLTGRAGMFGVVIWEFPFNGGEVAWVVVVVV